MCCFVTKGEAQEEQLAKVKSEKDGELAADVLKAEEFVRNMYKQRGDEWDGVRARARHTAQAYRSKVWPS